MKISHVLAAVMLFAVIMPSSTMSQEQRVTVQDVLSGEPIPADHRIAYGEHPMQFGDLRVPAGEGPWPLAILSTCWATPAMSSGPRSLRGSTD